MASSSWTASASGPGVTGSRSAKELREEGHRHRVGEPRGSILKRDPGRHQIIGKIGAANRGIASAVIVPPVKTYPLVDEILRAQPHCRDVIIAGGAFEYVVLVADSRLQDDVAQQFIVDRSADGSFVLTGCAGDRRVAENPGGIEMNCYQLRHKPVDLRAEIQAADRMKGRLEILLQVTNEHRPLDNGGKQH